MVAPPAPRTAEPPRPNPRASKAETGYLTNNSNVRAGPSTSEAVLVVLERGRQVAIAAEENGWSRITLADGREGFVSSRLITREPVPAVKYGAVCRYFVDGQGYMMGTYGLPDPETASAEARREAPNGECNFFMPLSGDQCFAYYLLGAEKITGSDYQMHYGVSDSRDKAFEAAHKHCLSTGKPGQFCHSGKVYCAND